MRTSDKLRIVARDSNITWGIDEMQGDPVHKNIDPYQLLFDVADKLDWLINQISTPIEEKQD